MSLLAAIDPGEDFAVAWFLDRRLVAVLFQDLRRPHGPPSKVVVEFPRIYGGPSRPGDILEVAYSAGFLAGIIGHGGPEIARVPTVAIPKSEVERRVRKALEPSELAALRTLDVLPKGKRHNCYDAVRHGLVYLARMAP